MRVADPLGPVCAGPLAGLTWPPAAEMGDAVEEAQSDPVVLDVGEAAARAARAELLTRAGYRVIGADTEEEARRLAAGQPVEVIIVDLPRRDQDCLRAIARLKADLAAPRVPVLRLVREMARCALLSPHLEASADMCLPQSAEPEALLATVGALLRVGRALREAERQRGLVETMLAYMPAGLLLLDPSGRLLSVNDRVKQVLQLEEVPAEAEARRRAIALYDASGERVDMEGSLLEQTLRTGKPVFEVERYLFREDGSRRTIRVDASPIPGRGGATVAVAVTFTDVTERRRMEEGHAALLAEAQHWRTLLDAVLHQMPSGVVVVNPEGDIVISNEEAKRISPHLQPGPMAEALSGGTEVRHPDGRRCTLDDLPVMRALHTGEAVAGEELIIAHDQQEVVVTASAAPIRGSAGQVTAAVTVFRDVTEKQRAQEERERQARLLEALIENTDYWLAYLDRDLRFVMVNSAFAAKSRLSREELIGKHFLEVFPGQTDIYAFYEQARDTGLTVSREELPTEIVTRPEWGRRFISFSMALVKDAEGNVEGVVLSALDVTPQVEARRRTEMAEHAWARQARLLEAIQESVPVGLAYLDRDLRFVQVNSTLAELMGLSREEAIGGDYRELCPGSEEVAASLARVRDAGEPFEAQEVHVTIARRPGVGTRTLDVAGVPVVHDALVEGVVLAVMDVTDRVEQREQLLAAERARTELAQNLGDEIAHRVKNNLAMVSGLLQMQAITSAHPEVGEALREAVVRVRMFANIHEQMYASRAEEVRLLEVLRKVAESTRAVFAARKEVAVTVTGEETTIPARAATNLSVVANELLTNGLKHGGPAQDGRLHVALSLDQHDGHLHLAVWNSGNPIAADFDPQHRPGMGMQLLWDVIVNGYGGQLHLEPRDGGTLAEAVIDIAALNE